jgi:hypothetical protein
MPDDGIHLWGEAGPERAWAGRTIVYVLVEDRQSVAVLERRASGEHVEERRSE